MGGIDIDLNAPPSLEEIEKCYQESSVTLANPTNRRLETNCVNVTEIGSTHFETPSRQNMGNSCESEVGKKKRRVKAVKQSWNDLTTNSKGEEVKKANKVIEMSATNSQKQPNFSCRVEEFGMICQKFDDLRRKWVKEMGFKGLLNLVDIQLPRTLCYWLMTRIDPDQEMLVSGDGLMFRLSKRQVGWILRIPSGKKPVFHEVCKDEMAKIVSCLENKYGKHWQGTGKVTKKVFTTTGILVTPKMLERIKGKWEENEEEEFKTLFLLLSLHLVLCPTQSPRLERDLIPAVTFAMKAREYDWSALVLDKLMASVSRFGKSFYKDGYADGCDGCSIFIAIFYLDKLDRNPVQWGEWPRVRVWSDEEMQKAIYADRLCEGGDYGKLGCVDVAYGENHTGGARDTDPPFVCCEEEDIDPPSKPRSRRRSWKKSSNGLVLDSRRCLTIDVDEENSS